MRTILGILLFVFIVFPCMVTSLYLTSLGTWVFDRAFYKDILDEPVVYDAFLSELPNIINEGVDAQTSEEQYNAALTLAFREVVTTDYLQEQTNNVVDGFFDFFSTANYNLDITVNLVPVKENLANEQEAGAFAAVMAENLPRCETGQEPRVEGRVLIQCLSNDMSVADAEDDILADLPEFRESLPDELQLNDPDVPFQSDTSVRDALISALGIMLVVSLVFWAATGFVGGVGRRAVLMWLGIMLIIPAALVMFTGVGVNNGLTEDVVQNLEAEDIRINGDPVSEQFRDSLVLTFLDAAERIANGFLIVGGVAIGTGILLLVVAFASPRREDEDERYVSVPG